MSDDGRPERDVPRASKAQLELYTKEAEMDDEETARFLRSHIGWKDWLIYDYSRYWYVTGAFLLDVLVLLTAADALEPLNWLDGLVILLASVGLVFLEVLGYLLIWPKGILTERVSVRRTFKRLLRRLGR